MFLRAKGLDSPGAELENVLMLETLEDANRIHNACLGCRAVIVGTSFVGKNNSTSSFCFKADTSLRVPIQVPVSYLL